MRNSIHIGEVYLTQNESHTRVSADIVLKLDNSTINRTFYYEVENEWGCYLVHERSDAFVLAFFELAMERGCDIVSFRSSHFDADTLE